MVDQTLHKYLTIDCGLTYCKVGLFSSLLKEIPAVILVILFLEVDPILKEVG